MKKTEATNPELQSLVLLLKKTAKEKNAKIWETIADHLLKPKRKRVAVNLGSINRHTKRGDTIIVPGKVLAAGEMKHSVNVAAFAFSEKAQAKIARAKGKCLSIAELMEKNPKGSNVKIIG